MLFFQKYYDLWKLVPLIVLSDLVEKFIVQITVFQSQAKGLQRQEPFFDLKKNLQALMT